MPTSSPSWESARSIVDQFEGELARPSRASRRATHAANCRAASRRRRFVDPTTCERDYSAAEWEFMQAMQDYKQRSGRMFPTWSEVLEVVRSLGYQKRIGSTSER
jgi:hypothetical protein